MKIGRPQTPYTKMCQFRIDPRVYRRIAADARREGIPMSAHLRRIIGMYLTNKEIQGTLST